jgi:hypothetical protein
MTVRRHWTAQDAWVFHSEWWLREHWGRLFDVDAVARPPRTELGTPQVTHSYLALTKRDVAITKDELVRCEPSEPRELAALETNVRLLRQELDEVVRERGEARQPLTISAALRNAVLTSTIGPVARSVWRRMRAFR